MIGTRYDTLKRAMATLVIGDAESTFRAGAALKDFASEFSYHPFRASFFEDVAAEDNPRWKITEGILQICALILGLAECVCKWLMRSTQREAGSYVELQQFCCNMLPLITLIQQRLISTYNAKCIGSCVSRYTFTLEKAHER